MNALLQFWNRDYGIRRALEDDALVPRLLNRFVVAALMNAFPKTVTRFFSLSRGELARLLFVERDGGSFRSLRAMYDYEDPRKRGDLINRLIMQSPAIKAARNRRIIAQQMLRRSLETAPHGKPTLVLAIGGGDGNLEAEVLAGLNRREVYYCAVDKDERAALENRKVFEKHGLDGQGFVSVGTISNERDLESVLDSASRRFGVSFDGIGATVCHGIAEYFDLGTKTNEALGGLLSSLLARTRPEGNLMISQTDYHDRVRYLERGLAWHMRLRGIDEVASEVEKAGWQISICEHEPMRLITMCLAVKSDMKHRRIDGPSRLKRSHVGAKISTPAR
jgi:hypothetical protein